MAWLIFGGSMFKSLYFLLLMLSLLFKFYFKDHFPGHQVWSPSFHYYSYSSINYVQDFITFLKSGRFDIQRFSKTTCRALSR